MMAVATVVLLRCSRHTVTRVQTTARLAGLLEA
jgi:hypothetical protein